MRAGIIPTRLASYNRGGMPLTNAEAVKSIDRKARLQVPHQPVAEAEAGGARPQLARGVRRLRPRDGEDRGVPLHPVPGGALSGRLPGQQRYPWRLPQARRRRCPRRRGRLPRDEPRARHVRAALPAGVALRGPLRRRQEGDPRRHWQARGVHRRLRARSRRPAAAGHGASDRQAGRGCRLRAGGLAVPEILAVRGHEVRVFEAWPAPGGVLRYGIPDFKMDKRHVDDQVEYLEQPRSRVSVQHSDRIRHNVGRPLRRWVPRRLPRPRRRSRQQARCPRRGAGRHPHGDRLPRARQPADGRTAGVDVGPARSREARRRHRRRRHFDGLRALGRPNGRG